MARALSSVRLDDHASCAFVLFIEGLADAWTTDASGALTGSGLGSWIYNSEVAIGGREIAGTRRVHPGLIVPESITFSIDPKSGAVQPSPCSFQLLDLDDSLATLFAAEGHVTEILGERIAPGITDLGSSVATIGGAGTTNPRGRWVGIEAIGPAGERRRWPALPFDLVGYDHPVHGSMESRRLPPVLISDAPIEFAGRMASLYRIYRDPSVPATDASAWFTWDQAEAAGDRVWWGVLRDAGAVQGNKIWSLDCHGPDALLRRTLGARTTMSWTRIHAELTLAPEESYVAIGFASKGGGVDTFFNSSIFDHQFTGTTRAELVAELDGWIEDALDGSDVNVAFPGGTFNTWADPGGSTPSPDAGVDPEGRFFIRRARPDVGEDMTAFGVMTVAMHDRVWRAFGFEPETQDVSGTTFEDFTHADFRRLVAGDDYSVGISTGIQVPGDGYRVARFTTIAAGHEQEDSSAYANLTGGPRYWWPVHTSEVFTVHRNGQQVLRLSDEEPANLYLEGQLTLGTSAAAEVDGSATTHARLFALRGKIVTAEDDPTTDDEFELSDEKDLIQVIRGSWVQGGQHGTVSEGTAVEPAIFYERLEIARSHGVNHPRPQHDWAGKTAGEGTIEIAPLHAYRHFIAYGEAPWEVADTLLTQILLSTGACAGYDAPLDDGGEIVAGPNTHPLAVEFAGDYELADLGLGIPYQLVAHPSEIREAFATVPGGWDGDFNRLRLVYLGPFESLDVLDSITRPRLMCWSLRGKQFGLFRLEPVSPEDADFAITEADLHGTIGDPTSVIPSQNLRATGQLDGVELSYRWDPIEASTAEETKFRALDAGASRRTGELIEEVSDHGLCPPWFGSKQTQLTGVTDWQRLAKQLWERDAPEFFARRHFSATLTLGRHLGQDAMPGCSVSIANPWLVDPTGVYGVAGRTGRVISATHNLYEGTTSVELLVFANDVTRHYAPFVRVQSVTGTTVEWYADNLGEGIIDGLGFVEPAWSTIGGDARVGLWQRVGETWTLVEVGTVVSANPIARTLVLAAPFTSWLRDRDHILTLESYSGQDANSWPRALFGVIAGTDLTIDGTVPAPKFIG